MHRVASAFLLQQRGLFGIGRAHHHRDPGVELACGVDHRPDFGALRRGHHQQRRFGDVRLDQRCRVAGIARHRLHAGGTQRLDALAVLLDDDEGDVACQQRLGNALADMAIAHQHHVPRQVLAVGARRQFCQRVVAAFQPAGQRRPLQDPAPRRLDGREQQRVQRDRQQRTGDDQALGFGRFVGSGPLPLSSACLVMSHDVQVDNVDIDWEACLMGAEFAQKMGLSEKMHFICSDILDFKSKKKYDAIFLASLVGLEEQLKSRIIKFVAEIMTDSGLLVIRSAERLRTLIYPKVDMEELEDFAAVIEIHPHHQVMNSNIIVRRK